MNRGTLGEPRSVVPRSACLGRKYMKLLYINSNLDRFPGVPRRPPFGIRRRRSKFWRFSWPNHVLKVLDDHITDFTALSALL